MHSEYSDHVFVDLVPEQFGGSETIVARYRGLVATAFRYRSGVAGLRISNAQGEIILLPFQGQQIWNATFLNRSLTMRSMFDEPVATRDYLSNYGAFFIHCGATAMGNPGPVDQHPLHGDLPNAPYRDVQLIVGSNSEGPFMALTGRCRQTVAFSHDYMMKPTVLLQLDANSVNVDVSIMNLKHSPMDLMYLAHINFRPADDGRLVDTVADDSTDIVVRKVLPPFFTPSESYLAYRDAIVADPSRHRLLTKGEPIDPELVLTMKARADAEGWAHALQVHPDRTADFVSFRPDELNYAVRWITRGADQDALGLVLPATAKPDGYLAAKERGRLVRVAAGETFHCGLRFGAMIAEEAARQERLISKVRAGSA
ncbi:DUF4432 family protein [Mesorhizobium loti]|uniref:DUF4432 family protein n=2 Tax=Mesorhizobium TaxID=68287 RepID=A0A6M7WUU9_RHILI|nr:DUF4432 family protein [Mesorhizobium loti]ABM65831.1 possible deoxyribose mutarotase [Mesorhizobium sp. R88B]QKD05917.1 DUF4432 family protein [Mesorhizobium loti R88b]